MFEILCLSIAAVIVSGGLWALVHSRDTLHPAVIISPLFLWMYALWPLVLNAQGGLEMHMRREQLEYVAWLYLAGCTAFMIGLVYQPSHIYATARKITRFRHAWAL